MTKRAFEFNHGAYRRRAIDRRAALDQILGRMAGVAIEKFKTVGLCTDDAFKAAGFSDETIEQHGDRARQRAVHVMKRTGT